MLGNTAIAIINRNEIEGEGLKRILVDCQFPAVDVCRDLHALIEIGRDIAEKLLVIVTAPADSASIDLCRQIRTELAGAKILLLAHSCASAQVAEAFREGADGYVSKDTSCASLVQMIRLVELGEKIIPSQVVFDLAEVRSDPRWVDGDNRVDKAKISEREIEILRGLVNGEPNKVISRRLGIREATVKVHIKSILRKLHVANRTQAAIWALSRGVVKRSTTALLPKAGLEGERPVERPGAGDSMAGAQIAALKAAFTPIEASAGHH